MQPKDRQRKRTGRSFALFFSRLATLVIAGGMRTRIICAILVFASLSVQAQLWQDLNFEFANNIPPSGPASYPNDVPIASALPGWTAYLGTQQITDVGYNAPTLSVATVCLIGPSWNSTDTQETGTGIIDGRYTIDLETGVTPLNPTTTFVNASIEQTGTIPYNAASLQFKESGYSSLSVSFEGNVLVPIALSSGVSADGLPYTLYGVNISPWDSQSGELEFSTSSNVDYAYAELDDITFSIIVVPEPNTWILTAMAGLTCGVRKLFQRGE